MSLQCSLLASMSNICAYSLPVARCMMSSLKPAKIMDSSQLSKIQLSWSRIGKHEFLEYQAREKLIWLCYGTVE